MGFLRLDNRNFCGLVAFLGILYTPGEIGFCICFFDVDLDTDVMDIFCFIDGVFTFIASILLGLGTLKETKNHVMAYMIIALLCEITYWTVLIYTLVAVVILMHYEFLLPALLWKLFQLYGLCYVVQFHRELKSHD